MTISSSTTTTSSRNPQHNDAAHQAAIRLKLLNRLGIYKQVPISTEPRQRKHVLSGVQRRKMTSFSQPLNDSHEEPISFPIQRPSHRRSCSFESKVTVVPIPSHHDYSDRIFPALWNTPDEIRENAERNRMEFAAEGWDWHTVLEEQDMYVDVATGELVHPYWLDEELLAEEDDGDEDMDEAKEEEVKQGDMADTQLLLVDSPRLTRSNSFVLNLQSLGQAVQKEHDNN